VSQKLPGDPTVAEINPPIGGRYAAIELDRLGDSVNRHTRVIPSLSRFVLRELTLILDCE